MNKLWIYGVFILISISFIYASHNTIMSFQGKFTNSTNNSITSGDITINISATDTCEGEIYSKTFTNSFSSEGIFDTILGNDTVLPLDFNRDYYLCVEIDGDFGKEKIGDNYVFRGGQGEIGTEDTDFTDQALMTTSNVNFNTVQATTVEGKKINFPNVDVSLVGGTPSWLWLRDLTNTSNRNLRLANLYATNLIELAPNSKLIFGYTDIDKYIRYNSSIDSMEWILDNIDFVYRGVNHLNMSEGNITAKNFYGNLNYSYIQNHPADTNLSNGGKVWGNINMTEKNITSVDAIWLGDTIYVTESSAGNIRFNNIGGEYMNIDLGEDWVWGATFSVDGGSMSSFRYDTNFQLANGRSFIPDSSAYTIVKYNRDWDNEMDFLFFGQSVKAATSDGQRSGINLFGETADASKFNWITYNYSNPTIWIHSADETDHSDYVTARHNQSFGLIEVGNGKLHINSSLNVWNITTGSNAGNDLCVDINGYLCACGSCA